MTEAPVRALPSWAFSLVSAAFERDVSADAAELNQRRGDFSATASPAAELLTLPILPGSSEYQLAWLVESVDEFFDRGV